MWRPPWYDRLEQRLMPAQWLVTLLLLAVIAVSIWALFSRSATMRTAWLVYLISP